MSRIRTALLACAALAVALAAPAVFACTYDIDFSRTGSGDVKVEVTSDCGWATVDRTTVSVTPGFTWEWEYGTYVFVIVDDSPGDQLYCAHAGATYWDGPNLAIDDGDSACETF
jgi:hypothetical protein